MTITAVEIVLAPAEPGNEKLLGYASIILDDGFIVHDIKLVARGADNIPNVFMPSRKITDHCPKCDGKNHLRARYCNRCGGRLAENRDAAILEHGSKPFADIAHPITAKFRAMLEAVVREEYDRVISAEK